MYDLFIRGIGVCLLLMSAVAFSPLFAQDSHHNVLLGIGFMALPFALFFLVAGLGLAAPELVFVSWIGVLMAAVGLAAALYWRVARMRYGEGPANVGFAISFLLVLVGIITNTVFLIRA